MSQSEPPIFVSTTAAHAATEKSVRRTWRVALPTMLLAIDARAIQGAEYKLWRP